MSDPVAKRDAVGAKRGGECREAKHFSLSRRLDGGGEEGPDLPEDYRRGEHDAGSNVVASGGDPGSPG
jgi:hypothetical protein